MISVTHWPAGAYMIISAMTLALFSLTSQASLAADADPFADLAAPASVEVTPAPEQSWYKNFFSENLGFRKEIMSQFSKTGDTPFSRTGSRQSLGFEVLKKFSTATATWASFNFQGRLVRRDHHVPTLNDVEGMDRPGWFFEYHNAYADLYNVLNPVLSDSARGALVGRFNVRVGRFYVPFGLNTQTDTHGTVLQLSNEGNFGFERDWYAGLWGNLGSSLDYGAYYLAGSGYGLKFDGQRGMGAARLSLSGKFASEYGLEGGVSFLGGERLSHEVGCGSMVVDTTRAGVDARWRTGAPGGTLALTTEQSGGRDGAANVYAQIYQVDYLHASRRAGVAAQYRRFARDASGCATAAAPVTANASLLAEATWYFRNDVANSNLHWIKLNVEKQTETALGVRALIATLQYYWYW